MIGEHNYNHVNVDTKLVREKVLTDELCIGMYVVELDRPWTETPFLFQGFLISSTEEVNQLREYCKHVFIDVTQTTVEYTKKNRQVNEIKNKRIYKVPIEQELAFAASHFDLA